MNYKKIIAAAIAAASVSAVAVAGPYKVTVPFGEDEEGAVAYLVNYDNSQNVDSVTIQGGEAVFAGDIPEAFIARINVDGKRSPVFFVEPGTEVVLDKANGSAKGGALNEAFAIFQDQVNKLGAQLRTVADDAARKEIYAQYQALLDKGINENINNVLGQTLFLEKAYDMAPEELDAAIAANPSLAKSVRVQSIVRNNQNVKETQPGAMFKDITVTHNGKTHRLSDVVGKGQPVLVDFWASWCGPCRREMPNLKAINEAYKDKGLKILGIAVWDKPADTERAVKELDIPWEIWMNGTRENTDAYGILSIPTIILFDKDGKIVSRGLQDEELRAAVDKYMSTVK